MQKITTCLWFNDNAEEAVNFYTSIFKNSKIGTITHYGDATAEVSGRKKGSVMVIKFELDGREFLALNGGPVYGFTPAISLIVNCDTQQELDEMWSKLSAGGQEVECGWLTDKFGLSWQIVPTALEKMMQDKDQSKLDRVMAALLQMTKLDIAKLQQAYEQ
jgi:predicted 3-demethylubiquinone-9 3-methyltransferase (glyoxalase superfamily)